MDGRWWNGGERSNGQWRFGTGGRGENQDDKRGGEGFRGGHGATPDDGLFARFYPTPRIDRVTRW
jgi:hypothetical protein